MMLNLLLFGVGAVFGGCVGVLAMAVMVASRLEID